VSFVQELSEVLPGDLLNRESVIDKASKHLDLIVEANRHFNLTRITDPREAAIKHVFDSVKPWRLFADVAHVLDAGTGAGFPGIPLAVALPSVRFVLSESIGKKSRFVESAVAELGLSNVVVASQRAEEVLRSQRIDIITARAMAPLARIVELFGPSLRKGSRLILYKGPDVEIEIEAAAAALRKQRLRSRILELYDLPEALGSRAIVEISG
jgi:16S rRNA (guanine527-N7)-methyltransferase